jgi:hypothetical protein
MKKYLLLIIVAIFASSLFAQNNCLDFDGTDDYVSMPDMAETSSGSIECWVKVNNFSSNNNFFANAPSNATIAFDIGTDGILYFYLHTAGSWKAVSTNNAVPLNTWFHVAGTWDGSIIRLYINGGEENYLAQGGGITSATGNMSLGRSTNAYLYGEIDEFRVWDDRRTVDEIRANMYKELAGTEGGLLIYYKLNETSGTNADDSKSGGTNDGTLTNMDDSDWQTSPAFFGPKNCLEFDGINDYVKADLATGVESDYITMETWVKWDNLTGNQNFLYIKTKTGSERIVGSKISDNRIQLYLAQSLLNYSTLNTTFTVSVDTWYHIAFVYSKDTKVGSIYINGVEMATKTFTQSFDLSGSDELNLACDNSSGYWSYVKLDEVRIWKTVRTASEIRENMFKTLEGDDSDLLAYYNFDNVSGNTAQCYGGNADVWQYDGTLYNMENDDWIASSCFNTWLNTNSTSWSTATNWSGGSAPASTDNVGVYTYSGGVQPASLSSAVSCNNLGIGTGATLSNSSNTLTVSGNVLNEGTLTIGGTLTNNNTSSTFINDGTFTDDGTVTLEDLTNNSGKTVDINETKAMTIEGDLDNSGTFTINSSATGTGSLIVSGTATGNVTVQRFITHDKWHYIAGQTNISDNFSTLSMGLTSGTDNDQFYRWEESLDWGDNIGNWVDILNGPNGNDPTMATEGFVACEGYAINYITTDKTLSLSGVPYTSNQSINITRTTNSTSIGNNLIGNPFCSTIAANSNADANSFLSTNSDVLDATYSGIYAWNEQASYQGNRDDYTTISNSDAAKYIEAGQGFIVCAKNSGSTSLPFNTNMRKHGTATFYKNSEQEEVSRFYMSVENDEGLYNEILIAFIEGMANGLDISYDVGKLKGNPDIALYSVLVEDNGSDFIHQALPPLSGNITEVKIGLDINQAGNYTFKIKELENFDKIITIKLEDKETGKLIDFRETEEYTFNISEAGEIRERFVLHFNKAAGIEDQTPETADIRFYAYDNKLYIIDKELKNGTIQLFNMLGQPVMEKQYSEVVNTFDLKLSEGYYVVRIITDKMTVSGKIYVE